MSNKEHLVEQKILEYRSRLKHIDELIEKVNNKCVHDEHKQELDDIKAQCLKLKEDKSYIDDISQYNWQEKTIEKVGPMALIDSVAQRIEKLVEKIE